VGEEALSQMSLSRSATQQIAELHGGIGRFGDLSTPASRTEALNQLLDNVKDVLDPDTHPHYLALVEAHFARLMLGSRGPS